jgi:hypothetical protein
VDLPWSMCAMMQKFRMMAGSVAAGTGAVRAMGDTQGPYCWHYCWLFHGSVRMLVCHPATWRISVPIVSHVRASGSASLRCVARCPGSGGLSAGFRPPIWPRFRARLAPGSGCVLRRSWVRPRLAASRLRPPSAPPLPRSFPALSLQGLPVWFPHGLELTIDQRRGPRCPALPG